MSDQTTQEQAKDIWNELEQEDASGATAPAEQPKTEQADEPVTQAAEAQAPAAETVTDPYANLPQEVRDELAGLRAIAQQVPQLTQRLRNVEGNLGGLKSQIQAAKEVRAAGGDAPTDAEIRQAQSDPEAAARLRREYPEFADGVASLIKAELAAHRAPEQTGVTKEDLAAMAEEIRDTVIRETLVEVRHPGWKQEIATPRFAGWYQRQAPEIRALGGSKDPRDAIRVLDLYMADRQKAENKHQTLSSAAALPQGGRSAPRVKSVDEMTPDEYWAYLDATGQ